MRSAPQNLLKEYVASQNFTNTADIMEAMKTMIRDVIEQVMEAEIDEELGRTRCQRTCEEGMPRNYRNGYTKKTVSHRKIQPECRWDGRQNPIAVCLRNEPA